MKKLQNNFTTPEQSKRLLELGMPADSADCYYMAIGLDAKKYGYSDFPYFMTTNYVDKEHVIAGINIPCWSVGRLIEIAAHIHSREEFEYLTDIWKERMLDTMNLSEFPSMIDDVIDVFFEKFKDIDFSKLEE